MYCAKTTEPIEMPFERLTLVGPRNHVLDGGQDRSNIFVAMRYNNSAFCQITLDFCFQCRAFVAFCQLLLKECASEFYDLKTTSMRYTITASS